jgi:hypothetical protein
MAFTGARGYVIDNYEHVVVRIYNVNDLSTVSVNCRVVQAVPRGRAAVVDLGWLDDADDIYISTFNKRHGAAWGYRLEIDGHREQGGRRGAANSAGFEAPEHSVIMAQGFEASGEELGTVGCAAPLTVSAELKEYNRVPEASSPGEHPPQHWSPPTFPFALIDAIGGWAPLALALLGFLAAASRREVRDFVRDRWQWGFVVGVAALLIALSADLVVFIVVTAGIGLVLLAALLYLRDSHASQPPPGEETSSPPAP